jgi:hypothetical protein
MPILYLFFQPCRHNSPVLETFGLQFTGIYKGAPVPKTFGNLTVLLVRYHLWFYCTSQDPVRWLLNIPQSTKSRVATFSHVNEELIKVEGINSNCSVACSSGLTSWRSLVIDLIGIIRYLLFPIIP